MTDAPAQADPGFLVQTLVYAGLEALRALEPLDLAAYLHESRGQGPQLFLGTPNLATSDPNEAFSLFSALRDAMGADHDGETVTIAGYRAIAITSSGAHSRGLHVLGRLGAAIEDADRLYPLAKTFGGLAHEIEAIQPSHPHERAQQPLPVRVAVEMIDGRAHAEVAVAFGDEFRTGTADEGSSARAVALAAVDAVAASLKVIDAGEGLIGGARAVLVLVADDQGRQELGAAVVDDNGDTLRATAIAALDAAGRLQS
ncbi:MAG: hypothetical protein ABR552_02750 [Actinomycetota bacterium]